MSSKVFPFGSKEIAVATSDKICCFTKSEAKIYKKFSGSPDNTWSLLAVIAPDTEYVSAAFSAAGTVRIEAGASEVLYAMGTTVVVLERRNLRGQGAPGVLDATGTLTAAMIAAGIVTSTTAAAVTATLDTGAVMDAALDMQIGESFDWSAIATGANAFTVTAAASGHTVVGSGVVATTTSGSFRTRKTAADTFVTYRLA